MEILLEKKKIYSADLEKIEKELSDLNHKRQELEVVRLRLQGAVLSIDEMLKELTEKPQSAEVESK